MGEANDELGAGQTSRVEPAVGGRSGEEQPGRRVILREGAKLAFVAPTVSTFFASQAYATNYSCYPAGHVCPGDEACCAGLACVEGACTDPCVPGGGLCFTDADCCSGDCDLGTCN